MKKSCGSLTYANILQFIKVIVKNAAKIYVICIIKPISFVKDISIEDISLQLL